MFEQIIGHQNVRDFLKKSVEASKVSQAYLFFGPNHVGKMTLARAFAEMLLHGNTKPTHTLEAHPDVVFVERLTDEKTGALKTAITIDQIRELRERLSYSSFLPSWKIAIISDAQTLTNEAANALLKTLEEPRGKTVIILLACDKRFIPETIISRVQLLRFAVVSKKQLEKGLLERKLSANDAEQFSKIARGRPGLAIDFFSNNSRYDDFCESIAERSKLLNQPVYERYKWIESQSKKWKSGLLAQELLVWREMLRDALLNNLGLRELTSFDTIIKRPEEIGGAAGLLKIIGHLRRLNEAENALRYHVEPKAAMEYAICNG